jgi:integrase
MAKSLHRLSVKTVAAAKTPGLLADGGGLYLQLTPSGAKSWVFIYRRKTKRTEIGLGSLRAVSLADARGKAAECRSLLAAGKNPKDARRGAKQVPTFGEMADRYVASMASGWKNEKHKWQWATTLREHARPLRDLPVDAIDVNDVLAVLKPHWETRPDTASRLRGRMERVFSAAKTQGYRTGENPAAWRENLVNLLPRPKHLTRGHLRAMPWADVPTFITQLRLREGVAARALEFLILTAARSGEVRGAMWDEINLQTRVWIVPAQRMKAGREHRVPLTERALAILTMMGPLRKSDGLIFPGTNSGVALSDMTLLAVLKRMKVKAVTVHGFRSSFRDWCGEETSYPREIAEAALAHAVGNQVELAYRRGDAMERRRDLMAAWGWFLEGETEIGAPNIAAANLSESDPGFRVK